MAEHYSFFDPIETTPGVYDREYNAQEFTDYFGALITTGVMKGAFNMLEVTANGSNMVTSINTGIAFVEAKRYFNDAPLPFTHDTETIGLSRIDRIVVRMDQNVESRYVRAFVKKGVASTNPVPLALTQNNTVYEISLAQIRIVGGQTFIASNAVTDERGTDVICPWAGSKVLPNFDDSSIGLPNGIATLDGNGSVPIEQLQNVPLPQDATTARKGVVQLNNTLNSTSTTQAATPSAVKQVNDKIIGPILILGGATATTQANSILIGNSATTTSTQSVAIGSSSKTDWAGVSVGNASNATGIRTVAVGDSAIAGGSASVALGMNTNATAQYSVALGGSSTSSNVNEGVLGSTVGNGTSSWKVPGNFSVTGTKNFEIPHPHPDKKYTHVIRHGAVESPTAGDTLYRYEIEAIEANQTVELQLPDYFEHLNTDVDVWVNPHLHFGRAFGIVENGILKVTCETAGKYKALVIGTRNDDNVQDWYIKGAERKIGESWLGETYVFEVDEISEVVEIEGVNA